MSRVMKTVRNSLLAIGTLFVASFGALVYTQGIEDAFNSIFGGPRDLFCDISGICGEDEETFVRESELYTVIWERGVLNVAKFDVVGGTYRATRSVALAEASMRMRADVSVTLGVNLELLEEEDIAVDNDANTVTVTLPPVQPIDCFLSDVEFYDEVCLGQCDELRDDLRRNALRDTLEREDFNAQYNDAQEQARFIIGDILDPLAQDYAISFVYDTDMPPPIAGSDCPRP